MSIYQRITAAIHTWVHAASVGPAIHLSKADGASSTFDYQKPNTIYLGQAEYHEVIRDRLATMPDKAGEQMVCGLRIVRVHLENYLQVAYVEGVQ